MKVVHDLHGQVKVLRARGPLVAEGADSLQRQFNKALEEHGPGIVLDLSGVPYVDSRGLEALVDLTEQLIRTGEALRVCGANETVREVFDITEVGSMFEQYDDLGAALGSVA